MHQDSKAMQIDRCWSDRLGWNLGLYVGVGASYKYTYIYIMGVRKVAHIAR